MSLIARHLAGSLNSSASAFADFVCDVGDGVVLVSKDWDSSQGTYIKLDYAGGSVWQKSMANYPAAVKSDAAGNMYVLDGINLYKIDRSNGSVLWQKSTTTGLGGVSYSSLTVADDGDCFVSSGSTDTLLRVAKFDTSGALSFEKEYTSATDEVCTATKHILEAADGSIFLVNHDNTGTPYLKLVKLTSSLGVTWSKSLVASGHSLAAKDAAILSDGTIVVSSIASATMGTLRLVGVSQAGVVSWTKSITDTGIANFFTNYAYRIKALPSGGFVALGKDDADRAVFAKFDNSGAMQWARTAYNLTDVDSFVSDVDELADGSLVVAATFSDGGEWIPSFLFIASDGTPLGTYAAEVSLENRATYTVATGVTYTVASDTDASVSATAGTATTSSVTWSTTTYTLTVSEGPDPSSHQAAGATPSTTHGTPTVVYAQTFEATSWEPSTNHGLPMASIEQVTNGFHVASGHLATQHGAATLNASLTVQAAGQRDTVHGTPQVTMQYVATTGGLITAHGSPTLNEVFAANGHLATQHGTPTLDVLHVASGHLATKHGTPTADLSSSYLASGHLVTQHGTPAYGGSIFAAFSTPPRGRHGTAKLQRNVTC